MPLHARQPISATSPTPKGGGGRWYFYGSSHPEGGVGGRWYFYGSPPPRGGGVVEKYKVVQVDFYRLATPGI